MPEIHSAPAKGVSRRTILKASAWSMPVVAVAVATPLASASTAPDLFINGAAGDTLQAFSPDRLRISSIAITSGFWLGTNGTTPTPPGSTLIVSYDNRLMSNLTLVVDSTAAIAQAPTVAGNLTTVVFTIPVALPAGGAQVIGQLGYDPLGAPDYYEDIESYSVLLSPPSGGDSNSANNGWVAAPVYSESHDAAVSATWTTATVPHTDDPGSPFTVSVPTSVSITANGPGDVPTGQSLSVWGPTSLLTSTPNVQTGVFTGVTVTGALLDGVEVSGSIGTPTGNLRDGFQIPLDLVIPSGQTLEVTLDVAVDTASREHVWTPGGYVGLPGGGSDRDDSNNSVQPV